MSWISEKAHAELARVRDAQAKKIYPYFRPFESGGLHTTIAGKPIVNFSSNDYLGMNVTYLPKKAVEEIYDQEMTDPSLSGIVFLQFKVTVSPGSRED